MSDAQTLGITVWNANGLKKEAIDDLLQNININTYLLFITETWLSNNTSKNLPTTWKQYHNYGTQTTAYRAKEGITLLINPICPFPVITYPIENQYTLTCKIHNFIIICFYLPNSIPIDEYNHYLMQQLNKYQPHENIILCGDFNARLGSTLGDHAENERASYFREFIANNGLTIWNQQLAYGIPTYIKGSSTHGIVKKSIIDLVITNQTSFVTDPQMQIRTDLSLGSDHKLVYFSFIFHTTPPEAPTLHPRKLWKIKKLEINTDNQHIREHYQQLISIATQPIIQELDDYMNDIQEDAPAIEDPEHFVDRIDERLTNTIYEALDASVGAKQPRPKHWKWFFTEEIQGKIQERERHYRRWRNSIGLNKAHHWRNHQQAAEAVRSLIQQAKNTHFRQFCNKLASNEYSKATSKIKQIRRSKGYQTLQHPNGIQSAVDQISNTWKTTFDGDTTNNDGRRIEYMIETNTPPNGFTDEAPFTTDDIYDAISKLPNNKAPGSDHIKAEMIKPINNVIAPLLYKLFSICWRFSVVPTKYNLAQVTPIYKKGDPNNAANYRPISLVNTFRKILEYCIYPSLTNSNVQLDPVQSGFRHQRSTIDCAIVLHELLIQTRKKTREEVYVAMLDIKSAYDTVRRDIIWNHLQNTPEFPTPLLSLLQQLYENTSIQVISNGATATTPFRPNTGIMQGTTISPFLYNIYINSLPSRLRNISFANPRHNTYIESEGNMYLINSLLFADDVACIGTKETLQRLLNTAEQHSFELGYRWNPSKCAILGPTQHNNTDSINNFKIYNSTIPNVQIFKYLGIHFNNRGMDSREMILHNTNKGTKAMNILHSIGTNSTGFDKHLSLKFYKSFIRPIFEYGLSIISTNAETFRILENAQHNCIRQIMGGHKTSSTNVIRHMNKIPELAQRKEILCAKNILRSQYVPEDSLLALFIQQIYTNQTFYFNKLKQKNTIWQALISTNNDPQTISTMDLKKQINSWLLDKLIQDQSHQFYLGQCRNKISNDPIMFIPMTVRQRSRIIRFRMGWLPGEPKACRNCNIGNRTTRPHLTRCLDMHNRLNIPIITISPIDAILNKLPSKKPTSATTIRYWENKWPVMTEILNTLEQLCLPEDVEFNQDPEEQDPFLKWIAPTNNPS